MKTHIRVCTHETCCKRGSRKIYDVLKRSLNETEHDIATTNDCFRFCNSGPNVAVNGCLLNSVNPTTVVSRIRKALSEKTVKREAIGTRSIDELDDALDELTSI